MLEEIEKPCSHCDGDGRVEAQDSGKTRKCTWCRGEGTEPTERGQELLEFMSRWLRAGTAGILEDRR